MTIQARNEVFGFRIGEGIRVGLLLGHKLGQHLFRPSPLGLVEDGHMVDGSIALVLILRRAELIFIGYDVAVDNFRSL